MASKDSKKRSFNTRLYNISQHQKFDNSSILSQKVLNYLVKCLSYCVHQHRNQPQELSREIKTIVPHAFGNHKKCSLKWCRLKQDPVGYIHNELPHGKDIHGTSSLQQSLQNLFDEYAILDLLRNLYNGGQGHGNLHRLLTTLHSAWLPNLHTLFTECEQLIVANHEQRFRNILVLDVCCKRLFFPVCTATNSTAKPRCRFIKVFFHNKGIDNVKLTSILHNKLVRSKVPIYFQEQDHSLVNYKYINNISRSVFNYNQTLRNIRLDDYHNASLSCDCESSTFRYEPHGHVITGDLRIIRN